MIAMPDARRPTYSPLTLRIHDLASDETPSTAAAGSRSPSKGKAKLEPNSQRSSSVVEEELPDIQLGVTERSWSKEKEAVVLGASEAGRTAQAVDDDDNDKDSST